MQSFNRNLRVFVDWFQHNSGPAVQDSLQLLQLQIERSRSSLDPASDSGISLQGDIVKSAQDELDDKRLIQEAEAFFAQGDQNACQHRCTLLVNLLGCNLETKLQARVLLGRLELIDIHERRYHLQRAVGTLDALVQLRPDVDPLRQTATNLLGRVSREIQRLPVIMF